MNPELVSSQLNFFLVLAVKMMAFLILVVYLLFSLMVVKQVQMMTQVLTTKIGRTLKWLALGHAMLAVVAFLTLLSAL